MNLEYWHNVVTGQILSNLRKSAPYKSEVDWSRIEPEFPRSGACDKPPEPRQGYSS